MYGCHRGAVCICTSPVNAARFHARGNIPAWHSLLGFAEKKRIITENPAKYWDEKTGYTDKRSERILSESQILCMIALEPSNRNKILLRFFYDIGLRISELCDLRWKHLRDAGNGLDLIQTKQGNGGQMRPDVVGE